MSEQPAADLFAWLRPLRARLSSLSNPVFVAYSGGLDSTVLLHEAVAVLGAASVTAVHINHGLSPNAQAWQQHCGKFCAQLGCEFVARQVSVERQGEGLEAAARNIRYQVFSECLQSGGVLLMGHHTDDQSETLLLNLLRGSGVSGLSGMPFERRLGNGKLCRPLLDIGRQDLQDYAHTLGLSWVEDESNNSLAFDRNYLRHEILPLLRKRYPHVDKALAETAKAMAEADALLEDAAKKAIDLAPRQLLIEDLQRLAKNQRHNVLRTWFHAHTGQRLSRLSLTTLDAFVSSERRDASYTHEQADWVFYCQRGCLFLTNKQPAFNQQWRVQWDLSAPLITPVGVLMAEPIEGGWQLPEIVEVSFRQGGEKINALGRQCHKSIKTLLKEYDIPAWQRTTLPLILAAGEVLTVADIVCSEQCKPAAGVLGYRLFWLPHHADQQR